MQDARPERGDDLRRRRRFAELERRLRDRATESAGEIDERLELARRQTRGGGRLRPRRRERRPRRAPSAELEAIVDQELGSRALQVRFGRHDPSTNRRSARCDRVDSRYALVIVAAKRARQINNYHHQLGEGTFDDFAPPLVESRSKNYLTMALEEIAEGKITRSA